MPINDIFGSTLAVLDNNNSHITNSFTYDPNGMMSLGRLSLGGSSSRGPWAFLYQGLESEPPDAAKLYWEPNGNIYNPDPFQISPQGPIGMGGGGNDHPRNARRAPKTSGNSSAGRDDLIAAAAVLTAPGGGEGSLYVWGALEAYAFFDRLFDGGNTLEIPPYVVQHTQRGKHPVYCEEEGICDQLPTQQGNIVLAQSDEEVGGGGDPAHDIGRMGEARMLLDEQLREQEAGGRDVNPVIGLPRGGSAAVKTDPFHAFPKDFDKLALHAERYHLDSGADLYQILGSLGDRAGRFEWIVDKGVVTHRFFVKGGTINGIPIKP